MYFILLIFFADRCLTFWKGRWLRAIRMSSFNKVRSFSRTSCRFTAVWRRWSWTQWRTGEEASFLPPEVFRFAFINAWTLLNSASAQRIWMGSCHSGIGAARVRSYGHIRAQTWTVRQVRRGARYCSPDPVSAGLQAGRTDAPPGL